MKKFTIILLISLLFTSILVYGENDVENTLSSVAWLIQDERDLIEFQNSKANFAVDGRTSGVGINDLRIINKNADRMFKSLDSSKAQNLVVRGNVVEVTSLYTGEQNIYSVTTEKLLVKGGFKQPSGYTNEVSYKIYIPFYNENGCGLINTATGAIVIQPIYKDIGVFYNDLAVATKKDGSYSIIDKKGNVLKNFWLPQNWQLEYVKGTNMIMSDSNGQFLYRAYSEIKSPYYSYCSFADYEIIAHKNYHYYILDSECKVKMDCEGYDSLQYRGNGLYLAHKPNDGYYIINQNNEIQKTIL